MVRREIGLAQRRNFGVEPLEQHDLLRFFEREKRHPERVDAPPVQHHQTPEELLALVFLEPLRQHDVHEPVDQRTGRAWCIRLRNDQLGKRGDHGILVVGEDEEGLILRCAPNSVVDGARRGPQAVRRERAHGRESEPGGQGSNGVTSVHEWAPGCPENLSPEPRPRQ